MGMVQCTKTVEGVKVWKSSQLLCTQAAKEETVLHKEIYKLEDLLTHTHNVPEETAPFFISQSALKII